jgi:predicted DNA-binding transcriptional regulator AlpA
MEVLSEREVAKRLGISLASLQRRRLEGDGPAHARIGNRLLYRWDDVERWFEAHKSAGRQQLRAAK